MADKDLKKNLEKMQGSGYISEDLKVEVGSFSLDGLDEIDDDSSKSEDKSPTEKDSDCKK
ncbi:hypothetical protein GF357_05365 [Candidatus Dojkabacteria bacterium]|nr:hypothetical protein [Candidatus Dojkabacteria bacterium]